MDIKIPLGQYFAHRANIARSRKDGQSRYYVGCGYLGSSQHSSSILLAPDPWQPRQFIFWNRSIHYCAQQLEWTPDILVGDMGYVGLHRQRRLRENMRVALVTKLKPDMILTRSLKTLLR